MTDGERRSAKDARTATPCGDRYRFATAAAASLASAGYGDGTVAVHAGL
jgi:hypothetical protein